MGYRLRRCLEKGWSGRGYACANTKVLPRPDMGKRGSRWRASTFRFCAQADFETGHLSEPLVEARDGIVSAQHVMIIITLSHATMPALLMAFLEQVLRPGVTPEYRKHCFPRDYLLGVRCGR